jgi:four helix bundle protein
LEVYRQALFLSELAWEDCSTLMRHPLGRPLAWQLLRSAGSVAANMEEGYGRGFGKEYGRFLRISLGSARETRGWYYRSRHVLRPEVVSHRLNLLQAIIGKLVVVAKQQANR